MFHPGAQRPGRTAQKTATFRDRRFFNRQLWCLSAGAIFTNIRKIKLTLVRRAIARVAAALRGKHVSTRGYHVANFDQGNL
jgi:hypothetical protein